MINAFFLLKERNITAFYHKCVIDTSLWKLQPKGKTKTLLIAIFFLLRRKITTITKSCSLVFFFLFWSILYIEPDHLFFLFASNSHFPVSEPLFTHPNSFPSIVPLHFYDHMPSHAPAVFPSIVPLPKSFHKPSFFSLSIHVRAFSDHMSCFCVSKIDRLCNICTPSTSYVEKGKVCGTLQGLKFSDSSEIEIKFDDRYSLPRQSGQSWKSLLLSRLWFSNFRISCLLGF